MLPKRVSLRWSGRFNRLVNERIVDCQQQTEHLASLGARAIPREQFLDLLEINQYTHSQPKKWAFNAEYQLV